MSLLGFCEGFWAGFTVGLSAGPSAGGRATGLASAAGLVLDGKSADDAGFPAGATALATADVGASALPAEAVEGAALATTSGAATAAAGGAANERIPTAPAIPATNSAPTPSAARTPDPLRFDGAGVCVVGAPVGKLSASELAVETPLVKVTAAGAALKEPLPSAE